MGTNLKAVMARIRSALIRRGRSVQDAEDLAQEAWIRMAVYQTKEVVTNPDAFLMRTALNLSIDAHRASTSRGEHVDVDDTVLVDLTPGAEDQLLARERVARLSVCLSRMPERSRMMFLANRVDGRSYSDIGRELGISGTAVEKHVTKAASLITACMLDW